VDGEVTTILMRFPKETCSPLSSAATGATPFHVGRMVLMVVRSSVFILGLGFAHPVGT
jgi:hypothetical protein